MAPGRSEWEAVPALTFPIRQSSWITLWISTDPLEEKDSPHPWFLTQKCPAERCKKWNIQINIFYGLGRKEIIME